MELLEITPEPGEAEREAILKALAVSDSEERPAPSAWTRAVLPARDDADPVDGSGYSG